jgi:hypothetical protein
MSTVEVSIKARVVTIKGPRGSITKDLSHMSVEMQIMKQDEGKRHGNYIRLRMWFGQYKQKAQVRTCMTLISNAINGVFEVSSFFHRNPPQSFIGKRGHCAFCLFFQRVNFINNNLFSGFRVSNTR